MTKIPSFAEIELGQPTAATDPAAWAVAFAAATAHTPEQLAWTTPEDIPVKPLYTAADTAG